MVKSVCELKQVVGIIVLGDANRGNEAAVVSERSDEMRTRKCIMTGTDAGNCWNCKFGRF